MKFLEHLKGLIANKTEYSKGLYALFKLEAKLAGLNLLPFLIGLIVLLVVAFTTWLTLMILVSYLILTFTKHPHPLAAIITVLVLNLGLAFYFIRDIKQRLQQMSFTRTRDCLRTSEEGSESESKEKAIEVHSRTGGES